MSERNLEAEKLRSEILQLMVKHNPWDSLLAVMDCYIGHFALTAETVPDAIKQLQSSYPLMEEKLRHLMPKAIDKKLELGIMK